MIIQVTSAEKVTSRAGDKTYLSIIDSTGAKYSMWSDAEDKWPLFTPGSSVDLEANGLFVREKGQYKNIVKALRRPASLGGSKETASSETLEILKSIDLSLKDINHNIKVFIDSQETETPNKVPFL